MKTVFLAAALFIASPAMAGHKQVVDVTVPGETEERAYREGQDGGLVGLTKGSATKDVVFMLNVIVNGEHARLKCYENHKGCSPLGPGTYKAELEKSDNNNRPSLWISMTLPISHKVIRDHWEVVGTW